MEVDFLRPGRADQHVARFRRQALPNPATKAGGKGLSREIAKGDTPPSFTIIVGAWRPSARGASPDDDGDEGRSGGGRNE